MDQLSTEDQQQQKQLQLKRKKLVEASSLAASMLWRDRSLVLVSLLVLSFIPFVLALRFFGSSYLLYLQILQRAFELLILWIITKACFGKFCDKSFELQNTRTYFLVGMIIWFGLTLVLQLGFASNQALSIISIILIGPLALFAFRHFFYHFFILCSPQASAQHLLFTTRNFVQKHSYLVIRTVWIAGCLDYLFNALCFSYDPFQNETFGVFVHSLFAGAYWILSCYLALAYCLSFLSEKELEAYSVDSSKLETGVKTPGFLELLLAPRYTLRWLICALLLYILNFARVANQLPEGSFVVDAINIYENSLVISLAGVDSKYHFRGFKPYALHLAGTSGSSLYRQLPFPAKVEVDGKELSVSGLDYSQMKDQLIFHVTFKTNRSGAELKQLEDLYLWYMNQKLTFVDMKKALVETK